MESRVVGNGRLGDQEGYRSQGSLDLQMPGVAMNSEYTPGEKLDFKIKPN